MTHAYASAELTAGAYLRKRREAARLTIRDVAKVITGLPDGDAGTTDLMLVLDLVEGGNLPCPPELLDNLGHAIRFVPEIYAALLAGTGVPPICRDCACSWTDPCVHSDGEACAWAQPDLCTACAVTSGAPAPVRARPPLRVVA